MEEKLYLIPLNWSSFVISATKVHPHGLTDRWGSTVQLQISLEPFCLFHPSDKTNCCCFVGLEKWSSWCEHLRKEPVVKVKGTNLVQVLMRDLLLRLLVVVAVSHVWVLLTMHKFLQTWIFYVFTRISLLDFLSVTVGMFSSVY